MRKIILSFAVLAALAVCCLIPGTPVNNDPSDAAVTAGIHLASSVSARPAVTSTAPLLAVLVVALAAVTLRRSTGVVRRPDHDVAPARSIDPGAGWRRRGPPALAHARV